MLTNAGLLSDLDHTVDTENPLIAESMKAIEKQSENVAQKLITEAEEAGLIEKGDFAKIT